MHSGNAAGLTKPSSVNKGTKNLLIDRTIWVVKIEKGYPVIQNSLFNRGMKNLLYITFNLFHQYLLYIIAFLEEINTGRKTIERGAYILSFEVVNGHSFSLRSNN